ncbi:MAG: translation initiation factor IF-2 [Eubacteriales bacterium]|nr:translation initiation factor IF-2 [Eubacteriales bacterium]
MSKKVYELAREIGVQSKTLVARAKEMGLDVKSHMSVLTDKDIEKLTGKSSDDDAHREAEAKKHHGPIGRAIVDEDFLARRQKAREEQANAHEAEKKADDQAKETGKPESAPEVKAESAPEAAPKKAESPAPAEDRGSAVVRRASKAEKPVQKAVEPKAEKPVVKSEAKKADEPVKQEPKAEKPAVKNEKQKASGEKKPANRSQADAAAKDKKAEQKAKSEPSKPVIHIIKKSELDLNRPSMGSAVVRRASSSASSGRSADGRQASTRNRQNRRGDNKKPFNKNARNGEGTGSDNNNSRGSRRNDRFGGQRSESEGQGQSSRRPSQRRAGFKAAPAPAEAPSQGRKRDDKRSKGKHSSFDKFDKFEEKSLERHERKKFNKPKKVEPEVEEVVLPEGTISIKAPITVAGFCEQAEVSTSKVIMALMKDGIMANINQELDKDTLELLAEELGIQIAVTEEEEQIVEEGIETFEDREEDLVARPPIITVMGHVDHGKTSLLDAIRNTRVTATESGGITQKIGASEVEINGRKIVFLDTPGHEAFTAMRARGAHITDIAVLVVAADDSVKPQTIESISHAKAAGVPIIVAINKMDKPGANPDRVKKDLADNGVLVEDWGGSVISVPVSAKTGMGIDDLLEMILLQADMLELKANPNRLAKGSVIEARLDKNKGPVATLLVLNGTLKAGQSVVAGTCSGRIRLMTNFRGKKIREAGPATAVEILGLTDVPQAGDEFDAVSDDKTARDIAEHRREKLREEVLARNSSTTLEKLFSELKEGEVKDLNIIVKADVQGSVGAIVSSLEKLSNDQVRVNVIHQGAGTVNESDVMLAETSDAIIVGFNVRPTTAVTNMADRAGVEIRLYRVIYDLIDDVEAAMKGMLAPEYKEEVLGKAEVRSTFKVPNVGIVAGAYITEGKVARNAQIRLVRDGIVIHEGTISSLKRFKDDAKEVNQGYECGLGIEDYNDIKEGDVIECFHMVEVTDEEDK